MNTLRVLAVLLHQAYEAVLLATKQPEYVVCENPDELGYWVEKRR